MARAKKIGPKKKTKDALRRRAERLLSKRIRNSRPKTRNSGLKTVDMKKLIQELQVHQVELEIQNEEFRKAQEEIEESRSKYVDLYDFAPIGYFTLTSAGKIVEVNLTGASLLGIERSQLVGRIFSVFIAPEFRSVFHRHYLEVLKKGNRERCELKLMKKDGTPFYARLESIAANRNKKNSTWIRSAVLDITEQKKAEENLNHRTKELETLAENAPDIFFRVDRNLRFVFVNKKITELTDIPKEQFYGKTLLDLGLPRDTCIYLGKKTQEVFNKQTHKEFEFSFSGSEGLQWLHSRIIPEFDIHGNVETVLGIAHDITDLKRAEIAYGEERAFRDSIEKSLRIGIAAVDLEGRQSYVNPSFCEMVGWSEEELKGAKPPFVYWPPEEMENITQAFQQVQSGEHLTGSLELRFQRRNGERFDALILFSPLKDSQGNVIGWVKSIGDITDRKQQEKEIRRLNIELEERVRQRTIELMRVNRVLADKLAEVQQMQGALAKAHEQTELDRRRLEGILETTPAAVVLVEASTGRFSYVNRRAVDLCGTDYAGFDLDAHVEKVQAFRNDGTPYPLEEMPVSHALKGEKVLNVEMSIARADGIRLPVVVSAAPLLDAKGNVTSAVAIFDDITERKRAEDALRAQEETLRAFFNVGNLHKSILELKEDDIVYKLPNQKTAEFFGLSVEEMTGKSLKDLGVPEKGIRFWLDHFRRSQKTRKTVSFEYRLPYKGREPWFQCSLSPIQNKEEQPSLFSFVAMEITNRKESEHLSEALNLINIKINSRLEFDDIMRNIVTEAGKAIGCKTAAISLKKDNRWVVSYVYGFPQELVGTKMLDEEEPHAVLAIKTREPVIIQDAYNDERVNPEHMKKYGVRSVLVVPILAGDNPIGVIFFNYHKIPYPFSSIQVDFCMKLASSVSFAIQNSQLLKELRHRASELENANKELESFSYSASHDLKAPLIVASGFCRRLSEFYGEKLDAKGRRYLRRIEESCRHMNHLIEDLLNLSKVTMSKIKLKTIGLSDLVKSVATQLKEKEPKRKVSFLIEDGLTAKGDSRLLGVALENLLGNAWKFTSKSEKATIEFGLLKPIGGEPTYFVRDNGCGFDMSMADKLFKPFQRLHEDEEFSGTGVGLATVHRIITKHGGRIWAESEVDQGTTFFFTLPS